MIPGAGWSTAQLIGTALMCVGTGALLIALVPTGGARPGHTEQHTVRRHKWQPRHTPAAAPRAASAGMPIEESLAQLALAKLMLSWPAQDRWPAGSDTDLVRPYVPGRHTSRSH